MEAYNNTGGGFFTVDEDNELGNYGPTIDDEEPKYESDPETLNRNDIQVPPLTETIKKQLKRQVHVPITCKMFLDSVPCPDDIFFIDGFFFKDVAIIGRVSIISTSSKSLRMNVNDNHGIVEVTVAYKDYESQPPWSKNIKESTYYIFYGQTKIFKDKRAIYVSHGAPITDYNQLTHHFLNVTLNKWIRKKGVLSPMELKEGKRLSKNNEDSKDDTNDYSKDGSEEVRLDPNTNSPPKRQWRRSRQHQLQEWILETIDRICEDEKSAKMNEIYKKLEMKVPRSEFDEAISDLVSDVKIISHDDNFSFCVI